MKSESIAAGALAALLAVSALVGAPRAQAPSDWTEPVPPFAIADNLYYVGSQGLASYLVTTSAGHVLINSSLVESVLLLRASVEQLGFEFDDIEILLVSHAHWDHCAGSAPLVEATGARLMVMDGDAAVVGSGGQLDFQYGGDPSALYPPAKVDRVLRDRDEVELGEAVLVAHRTPGHTKGCTTWTLKARSLADPAKLLDVVIVGSPNVNPGYRLVNNPVYWEMAADFRRGFQRLDSLPCDVFLGAHGSYFDLDGKRGQLAAGAADALVDPAGYVRFVEERQRAFEDELSRQLEALAIAPDSPRVEISDREVGRRRAGAPVIVQLRAEVRDEDAAFLYELYAFAMSRFGGPAWTNTGPDADYRELVFFSRGRRVQLISWHPLFERSSNLVAASYGVTSLEGRDREAFLKEDDPAYVAKRQAFDEVASRLREHYGRSAAVR